MDKLELQLSEMEMLGAMFPSPGELRMPDEVMLEDMRRYIDGLREATPRCLAFTVTLHLSEPHEADVIVLCTLPLEYPDVIPEVFVRSESMTRASQKSANDALLNHITDVFERGELCMASVLTWVQENIAPFIDTNQDQPHQNVPTKRCKYSGLSRLWIYSHHIYRKELLKKIPEAAKELDLTGFVLSGKPGIICVEGLREHCDEYWQRLRYPNWKHISCKHREDHQLVADESLDSQLEVFRIFSSFEELAFEAHGDFGLRNDYHMDLGQFLEYLKRYQCDYVYKIFFGLEGKSGTS